MEKKRGAEEERLVTAPDSEEQFLAQQNAYPGFFIRRLNQISISLFLERMSTLAITPLQYTIMRILSDRPGQTQKSIATDAVLDAATTHDILSRLESKGFLTRLRAKTDRRARVVSLTAEGIAALRAAEPVVRSAQQELVSVLSSEERREFVKLLEKIVDGHRDRAAPNGVRGPWSRQLKG